MLFRSAERGEQVTFVERESLGRFDPVGPLHVGGKAEELPRREEGGVEWFDVGHEVRCWMLVTGWSVRSSVGATNGTRIGADFTDLRG